MSLLPTRCDAPRPHPTSDGARRPRVAHLAAAVLLAVMAAACSHAPRAVADAGVTFVVVRHAEKASDDPSDPTLTADGQARAQRLARSQASDDVTAVYATGYRRTRQTAAPTARAHGLDVTTYDARVAADAFAATLRRGHVRGTVLVVGHSNTAPAIAAALCGCVVPPMDDSEYDRRMTVRIDAGGTATLVQSRDR